MKLYSYYRSSSAYRVRIALALKGLDYETVPVNLVEGEQRASAYLAVNAQGLLPALEVDGALLTQSTAILEWLEEAYPGTPLYPRDGLERARVRALCQHIACEIQPLNNQRVLRHLREAFAQEEAGVKAWYAKWVSRGFEALEAAAPASGYFAGDAPGMVEVFLVPQLYNARRFEVDLAAFPRLTAVGRRCDDLDAFARAHPDRQPDAPA